MWEVRCQSFTDLEELTELTAWQLEKKLNELMPHVAYRGGHRVLDTVRGPFTTGIQLSKEDAVKTILRFIQL